MTNLQKLNGYIRLGRLPDFGNVMNGTKATYCLWHHSFSLAKGKGNSHSNAPQPTQDCKSIHSTIYPQFIPDYYRRCKIIAHPLGGCQKKNVSLLP